MGQDSSLKTRSWYKILGIFVFCIITIWLKISNSIPDLSQRLATIELLTLVLCPLMFFYLRNNWKPLSWIVSMIVILLIVAATFSFLHEISHVIGLYLIGSKPTGYQLIPEYWKGDFKTAWVNSVPVNNWTGVIPGLFPYIKDIAFLILGFTILRRKSINHSFLAGFIYAFFCLGPLFNIINNYLIKLILGKLDGNDFYGVTLGWGDTWSNIIGVSFSIFAICICIWIPIFYKDFPRQPVSDISVT
jgi:hypothetical protein